MLQTEGRFKVELYTLKREVLSPHFLYSIETVFSDGVKAWSRERIELNTGKKKEIQDETLKKSRERDEGGKG